MIYLCDEIPDNISAKILSLIPERRIQKAKKYRRQKDQIICILGYYLFLYGVFREYQLDGEKIQWEITTYGKPILKNHNNIYFNISHCDLGIVCILDNNNVGIDIQNYYNDCDSIKEIAFNEKEQKYLNSLERDRTKYQNTFLEFWCAREAYYKYLGTGMRDDMSMLDFSEENDKHFEKYGLKFSRFNFSKYHITICGEKYYKRQQVNVLEEIK